MRIMSNLFFLNMREENLKRKEKYEREKKRCTHMAISKLLE